MYINCTCPKLAKCFDEPYCLFRPSWRGSSRNALPDPAPPSDDGMGNMEDEDAESEDAEHDALVDPCPEDMGLKHLSKNASTPKEKHVGWIHWIPPGG